MNETIQILEAKLDVKNKEMSNLTSEKALQDSRHELRVVEKQKEIDELQAKIDSL